MDLSLLAVGALTGCLVGLTGVGGGALMTPLLVLVFGVAPPAAVGTDLWFSASTKVAATRIHHGHGLIDWGVVRRLWLGSLPASVITLLAVQRYLLDGRAVAFLKAAVTVAVLVTALGMLFQKTLHGLGKRFRLGRADRFKALQMPLTVAVGAMLGTLVTLTSVGAGALGAVFLAYLYPLRLTTPKLIATDIVHAIPVALFAGIGHFLIGNVDFVLLGNLLAGSIPAVMLGAFLSVRLPHRWLRGALSVVLFSIGAKLLEGL